VPLYEAEIVEEVEMSTIDVLTVKDARLAPQERSRSKAPGQPRCC